MLERCVRQVRSCPNELAVLNKRISGTLYYLLGDAVLGKVFSASLFAWLAEFFPWLDPLRVIFVFVAKPKLYSEQASLASDETVF